VAGAIQLSPVHGGNSVRQRTQAEYFLICARGRLRRRRCSQSGAESYARQRTEPRRFKAYLGVVARFSRKTILVRGFFPTTI
jgi:hypothetical protein